MDVTAWIEILLWRRQHVDRHQADAHSLRVECRPVHSEQRVHRVTHHRASLVLRYPGGAQGGSQVPLSPGGEDGALVVRVIGAQHDPVEPDPIAGTGLRLGEHG